MAANNNIPPASTTDPEILNIALRALSLDISSATHSQGVVDHTGNKSANEALVSPQHFEAPTPRHTPTVSYDGGFSLPFGSMGRSNLAADGQQWDHDWSNSEALAAQRGQKMSTKDDHVSTSALDGAKAFDIRLQQQQQQQVQDQHASSAIFDSYRSPRAQQQAGGYLLLPPLSRSSLPMDRTTHVGVSPRPRPALCA